MPALLAPPPITDATRREFLAAVAATGLLAGCATPARYDAAAPGYPRTVTHEGGTSVIPTRPERVACLSPLGDLEALLALGIAPVQIGVRSFFAENGFLGDPLALWQWQEDALDALGAQPERVNADSPADAEVVARARPDLVVGLPYWLEDARRRLDALAPVIVAGPDWRANLRTIAEVFDRAADAETLITDTDGRIASSLDGIDVSGARVAFAYPQADVILSATDPADPIVDLFTRAGFGLVDELAGLDPDTGLSYERIGLFGPADLIVVTAYAAEDAAAFLTNPLFTALPAVAAGRVHVIEQGPVAQAIATFGPLNADVVLPEVRTAASLLAR